MKVLVLNGANLNLVGIKDPGHYGSESMEQIEQNLCRLGEELGCKVEFFGTNYEGELIDKIQEAYLSRLRDDIETVDAILINAATWAHYSRVIYESLRPYAEEGGLVYELVMSNVYQRDEWRHHSVISPLASGILMGMGPDVYYLGLRAAVSKLSK